MRVDGDGGVEKYCLDCPWTVTEDEVHSTEDLSRRTLEHFLETGHTIESTDPSPPLLSDRD